MSRWQSLVLATAVLASAVALSLVTNLTAMAQAPAGPAVAPVVTQEQTSMVFLPSAQLEYPRLPTEFGVQVHDFSLPKVFDLARSTGTYWVRYNAFLWDRIEPVRTNPPTYHWEVVDEKSLLNAASRGMQIIATTKMTPSWAQKVAGSFCSAVRADAIDEYAQFLAALVRRYGAAPFNVRYFELGNEVDVDPSLVRGDEGFGCWGDQTDPYYGGRYYGAMLQALYPVIKAADPRAQVVFGGLLLDCDWTHPKPGELCTPSRFFEGALRQGAGESFDVVSFHGYPQYSGSLQQDAHFPSWSARGGVVLGKVDFLREAMRLYGIDKPILHTEGSLICSERSRYCNPPGADFYEAQADYAVWLFVRNWAAGLLGTTWYDLQDGGWRYSGLIGPDGTARPSYHSYKFLTEELRGATYVRRVTGYDGIDIYEFRLARGVVWVLWTPDEVTRALTLPEGTLRVLDKYGADVTPSTGVLSVRHPVYVEITP
jgi:hypothetical protein